MSLCGRPSVQDLLPLAGQKSGIPVRILVCSNPCYVRITLPDAAVIAVVPAAITYFNQSTDINPVSEMPEADLPCLFVNDS